MKHLFDVRLAKVHGIEAAVLLENLHFWQMKNESCGKHEHDGRFWTYNTSESFAKLFPYMSKHKIGRLLKRMEDEDGLIKSGNYNKTKYDRTKWYTITDYGLAFLHSAISQNGEHNFAEPIPDIKPDNETDIIPWKRIQRAWNEKLDILPGIRIMTDKRKKHVRARIKDMEGDKDMTLVSEWEELFDFIRSTPYLCGINQYDWACDFDWLVSSPTNFAKVIEGKYK